MILGQNASTSLPMIIHFIYNKIWRKEDEEKRSVNRNRNNTQQIYQPTTMYRSCPADIPRVLQVDAIVDWNHTNRHIFIDLNKKKACTNWRITRMKKRMKNGQWLFLFKTCIKILDQDLSMKLYTVQNTWTWSIVTLWFDDIHYSYWK